MHPVRKKKAKRETWVCKLPKNPLGLNIFKSRVLETCPSIKTRGRLSQMKGRQVNAQSKYICHWSCIWES